MHFPCFKQRPPPATPPLVVICYISLRTLGQSAIVNGSFVNCLRTSCLTRSSRLGRGRGSTCPPVPTAVAPPPPCPSPGMAIHRAITESAVLSTWSSGTTWSTRPTWRASAGRKSNPSCRACSEARCPMVFTKVSLNLEADTHSRWAQGSREMGVGGWAQPGVWWSVGAAPSLTRRGRRCPAGSRSAP